MSFLSHIGLSIVDKLTGNALDKVGNAIKDGDASELIKQLKSIFEGVEDRLEEISDLFEGEIDNAKKAVRREVSKVKRQLLRETREELQELQAQFGDKLADAMKEQIERLVELEVIRQLGPTDKDV